MHSRKPSFQAARLLKACVSREVMTDKFGAAASITYSYDANGNEISNSAGRQWSYYPKDQATSVTPAGGSPIPMTYTGFGQFKRVSAGSLRNRFSSSRSSLLSRSRRRPLSASAWRTQ